MNKRASERGARKGIGGGRPGERRKEEEGGGRGRRSYVHGDVPGHVDVGFVLVHPNLGGAQGIPLGVVIDVVVVGLLGALDVRHPGAGEDLHAAATLPHLDKRGNGTQKGTSVNGVVSEFELEQPLGMPAQVTQLDKIPGCDE